MSTISPLTVILLLLQMTDPNDSVGKGVWASSEKKEFEISFKEFRLTCWLQFANACPPKTDLLIMIPSLRDRFEIRNAHRRTWITALDCRREVARFLIADRVSGEPNDVQKKLEDEQTKYGDLVIVHGFVDVPKQLHLKWYGGLVYQQKFCADAEWVMKMNDHVVINPGRLNFWRNKNAFTSASSFLLSPVFYGVLCDGKVARDPNNPWYVSKELYPKEYYPQHICGDNYLTTSRTITAIMAKTQEVTAFWIDYVLFTGFLGENITKIDRRAFFNFKYNECVDGMPTAFSVWFTGDVKGIEKNYENLKKISC